MFIKKHKRNLLIYFGVSVLFFGPVQVFANGYYGLRTTAGAAGLQGGDIPTLAGNVIGTALSMIGVLFFILMIYGGFTWMTARGNEQQTEKAKTTITAAVIGMIIVLASYAITRFVFQAVSGGAGGTATTCTTGNETYTTCAGQQIGGRCLARDGSFGACTLEGTVVGACECR